MKDEKLGACSHECNPHPSVIILLCFAFPYVRRLILGMIVISADVLHCTKVHRSVVECSVVVYVP